MYSVGATLSAYKSFSHLSVFVAPAANHTKGYEGAWRYCRKCIAIQLQYSFEPGETLLNCFLYKAFKEAW